MSGAEAGKREAARPHVSCAARKRLARRHAAERRFRAFGLVAVGLALFFLLALLSAIVARSLPAFTAHYLRLPLAAAVDGSPPAGGGGSDRAGSVDVDRLIREALRAQFPQVSGRGDRRKLHRLLSSVAALLVRRDMQADPERFAAGGEHAVLLSDTADLYLKGLIAGTKTLSGRGMAVPSDVAGDIRITSTADDFVEIGKAVRDMFAARAAKSGEKIAALRRAVEELGGRRDALARGMENAGAAERAALQGRRDRITADLEAIAAQIQRLQEEADKASANAGAENGTLRLGRDMPSYLVRMNGGIVRIETVAGGEISGRVLVPLSGKEPAPAHAWSVKRIDVAEAARKVSDQEIAWLDTLRERGRTERRFNWLLLTAGASRKAEFAGIGGAVVGSFHTMLVTLVLAFPLGVAAAVYLEEFAPESRLTRLIEVNINNLAAVPSIVFGLLGLAIFLNVFHLPRSAPLVGGMVLALMTLPTIIIAARAALRAVPPSIREAALGIGASRLQCVAHHVLPLAMPGIMTGTIIGMAQALGETAPLLLIGMVAFIVGIPGGPLDPATVLPVQIYMWADFPEAAFRHKTAAAIVVLLVFLIAMNAVAVVLRKRWERRW